jgi:hypothetical protein
VNASTVYRVVEAFPYNETGPGYLESYEVTSDDGSIVDTVWIESSENEDDYVTALEARGWTILSMGSPTDDAWTVTRGPGQTI